jgi:hypothetical protein
MQWHACASVFPAWSVISKGLGGLCRHSRHCVPSVLQYSSTPDPPGQVCCLQCFHKVRPAAWQAAPSLVAAPCRLLPAGAPSVGLPVWTLGGLQPWWRDDQYT